MIYWSIIDQKFHELIHTQIACLTQCSFIFNYLIIDNSYLSCPKVCLFVCLYGVYRTTREFFTHMGTSSLPVKGCKLIDLCSALMAIEQWGFFSVPHLLWHGASVYNGHLRRPATLTPIAERLAMELSLSVFTCRGWDSNTHPSACGNNALTNSATASKMGIQINNTVHTSKEKN